MLNRLVRLIIGIIFLFTLPITIIPMLLWWVLSGHAILLNIIGWILDE
jgi:hypothetical protein